MSLVAGVTPGFDEEEELPLPCITKVDGISVEVLEVLELLEVLKDDLESVGVVVSEGKEFRDY